MAGESWEGLKAGLSSLIGDLQSDPFALETAAVSIISFASAARQEVPLTELYRLTMPRLRMGSGTALGAGLRVWVDAVNREVRKTSSTEKGDYKPVTFILTDGVPTDEWERVADEVKRHRFGANVVACSVGSEANTAVLKRITNTVLHIQNPSAEAFRTYMQWASASISSASVGVDSGVQDGIELPKLKEGMELAEEHTQAPSPGSHVFLHSRCAESGEFYLYRYELAEAKGRARRESSTYEGVAAIPIPEDEFDLEGGASALMVPSDDLAGQHPCPYCASPWWGMCDCGRVHCMSKVEGHGVLQITCPWCKGTAEYEPSSFDVGRGAG